MTVLAYLENIQGKLTKKNFEVASYASQLSSKLKCKVNAIIFGLENDNELMKLSAYGIHRTIKISLNNKPLSIENQVDTIIKIIKSESIETCVFPDVGDGKLIAIKLSSKLNSGLITTVETLPESVDPFIINKKIFSGKIYTKIKINTNLKILTLAVNSFGIHRKVVENVIEEVKIKNTIKADIFKIIDRKSKVEGISLLDADIVVSGGRGMKNPNNWHVIEDLAKQIGAALACSRPVSDDGWRSHEEHVGQTGKLIAPKLYFAVGISGATQHIAGVNRSKCIVAINTDQDAPIFEAADYGIVGDAMKVLPKLTNAFKEFMKS